MESLVYTDGLLPRLLFFVMQVYAGSSPDDLMPLGLISTQVLCGTQPVKLPFYLKVVITIANFKFNITRKWRCMLGTAPFPHSTVVCKNGGLLP